MPRFFFEAIAFGGILLMILYLMIQTGSFNKALPIISLYVFAGYRLIPAFQQIYVSFNQLSFVGASLDFLYNDLKSLKHYQVDENQNKLFLNNSITLKQIYYNYPNNLQSTLKNINMNIAVNTTVGIVGATGSGKTTTVDIILGLLEAHKGSLEVDGQAITKKNFRAWQRSIGYVPQHIYLSDDTVAANIAFGIKPKDIDKTAVEKASKIANLHEFVMNELSNNYNTTVGERGIRLSGGQRQRIGIARALYHNPQILVLDEATSALDSYTESVVMDAIENLGKNKTVILIAHRLSTVKKCDKIFLLEDGQIKKEGTFEQLITTDYKFRNNKSN
jgi:ABC-type multidrug transport system fused ATPase/permease subunit